MMPNGCRWCGSTEGVGWAGWCGVCLAHLEDNWVLTQEEEEPDFGLVALPLEVDE